MELDRGTDWEISTSILTTCPPKAHWLSTAITAMNIQCVGYGVDCVKASQREHSHSQRLPSSEPKCRHAGFADSQKFWLICDSAFFCQDSFLPP